MKIYTVTASFMVVGESIKDVKENLNLLDINFHELKNIKVKPVNQCLPGFDKWFPYTANDDIPERSCSDWVKEINK